MWRSLSVGLCYVLMCVSLCSELHFQRPCSPEMTSVYGASWRNALEWWAQATLTKQQLCQKCSVQTKHEIWTCKRDILFRLWCSCPHAMPFLSGNTLSLQELSKITMPIVFNEPLSFLQRITEYMEHTYLIHKACTLSDSIDRMQVGASGSLIIYFHMCACMEDLNKSFCISFVSLSPRSPFLQLHHNGIELENLLTLY